MNRSEVLPRDQQRNTYPAASSLGVALGDEPRLVRKWGRCVEAVPAALPRALALALVALTQSACTTQPQRPVNADGTYCFRAGTKSWQKTCTWEAVPGEAVEAAVKRFEPTAGALTLYIVRHRWADATNVVEVVIDERTSVRTVPESLVRIRLAPGEHRVAVEPRWQVQPVTVSGRGGEVQFVELVGFVWSWRSDYRLVQGDARQSRSRATASKLVADVDLRQ